MSRARSERSNDEQAGFEIPVSNNNPNTARSRIPTAVSRSENPKIARRSATVNAVFAFFGPAEKSLKTDYGLRFNALCK